MLRRTCPKFLGIAVSLPMDRKGIPAPGDDEGRKKIKRAPKGKRYRWIDHNVLDNEYLGHGHGHGDGHGHGHAAPAAASHGHGDSHGHGHAAPAAAGGHDDHGHGHDSHGHDSHGHDDHHGHHEMWYPETSRFSFNSRMRVAHFMLEDIPATKMVTDMRTNANTALTTTKVSNQIAQVNISEIAKSDYEKKHPNYLLHKKVYRPFVPGDTEVQETEDWYEEYHLSCQKVTFTNEKGVTFLPSPFARKVPQAAPAK